MINGKKGHDCMDCAYLWKGMCRRALTIGMDVSSAGNSSFCGRFKLFGEYPYGHTFTQTAPFGDNLFSEKG